MTAIEFNHQITTLGSGLERFALSLTANPDDAKDLLQETYLKAILNREKFTDYTNLKAWVYTIMKNSFINNYRKSIRKQTIFNHSKDDFYLNNTNETHTGNPESDLSANEIREHIDNLEVEFRVPFQMFQDGYKYKEIAEALDLKIGTVKSRIFFGRRKLMEQIEKT